MIFFISKALSVAPDESENYILSKADNIIDLTSHGLSEEIFSLALEGYQSLLDDNCLERDTILSVIDYSMPSDQERMFVIDMKNKKLLFKSLVAHGKASGDIIPCSFSNQPSSHKSSLGFFVTGKIYNGKHGYSLTIEGMEKDINNNAGKRAIVFHGAAYVSLDYIGKYGRIGRSFGCPALPQDMNRIIIDIIKDKSCVFIYAPDPLYFMNSTMISSRKYCQRVAE